VGSPEPCLAAQSLSEILKRFRTGSSADLGFGIPYEQCSPDHILNGVLQLISEIRKISPLVHQVSSLIFFLHSFHLVLILDYEYCSIDAISECNTSTWGQSHNGDCASRDGRLGSRLWSIIGEYRNAEGRRTGWNVKGWYALSLELLP
jgi:hypothetical protein